MLVCPGWCGEEFVDADLDKNAAALQKHLLRCVKGHATVSLLDRYTRWLIESKALGHISPENETFLKLYVDTLTSRFMADEPPTDPRVMYSRLP
jgi:hypothetical protein